MIAPLPGAMQGELASWVDDHVDDLVKEFSLANDVAAPATEEGRTDDDDWATACPARHVLLCSSRQDFWT